MKEIFLNIAYIIKNTKFLGPFNRFVIYLQGCDKNCVNCISPDWKDVNVINNYNLENLIEFVLSNKNFIEGITISGGEPFLQIEGLFYFTKIIKKLSNLGIIIFTGYTYDELLNKKNEYIPEIFNYIDLLIDGQYKDELNDNKGFRGSTNQNFIFLSERYKKFENDFIYSKRDVEININDNIVIGIPSNDIKKIIK